MATYTVIASQLNLRRTPGVTTGNLMAALPNGQEVEVRDKTNAPWWNVDTTFHGTLLNGFVHSSYLKPTASTPAAPAASGITAVHLGKNTGAVPGSANARAYPIGDSSAPKRGATGRPAALAKIITYLDVERGARYQPTSSSTYCNIYACDYCYLAGVYLPRVWWLGPALEKLGRGESVDVRYGETVGELNANSLFTWLNGYGPRFGWRRVFDLDAMQTHANAGGVGVICAIRKELNRSGHIAAVVPETTSESAARTAGSVVRPLQSQAGARNFRYTNGPRAWWQGIEFREFGFFMAD